MAQYNNFDQLPIMMSVQQAADVLGVSDTTMYRIIRTDKDFPCFKLTRRVVVPKDQFRIWINNHVNGVKISGY